MNIKEIDAPKLIEWLDDPQRQIKIIDVREISEISAGTIPGALPMPMATIPVRLQDIPRDEEIVFICRSGARSAQVCAFLQHQGFDKIYNLRGGMFAWAGAGQPIGLPKAS